MQFPHLFSPLQLGRVTVANRVSFSAHLTNLADDGLPTERLIDYHVARARGGTGLIITEEQSVHPTDRAYEHLIEAFQPEVIPLYRRWTAAVHEYDTRIFAQLNHNGQQCSGSLLPAAGVGSLAHPRRAVPRDAQGDGAGGHPRGDRLLRALGRARARGRVRRRRAAVRPQLAGAPVHVAAHQLPRRRVRRRAREPACGSRSRSSPPCARPSAPTSPSACGSAPTSSSPAGSRSTT